MLIMFLLIFIVWIRYLVLKFIYMEIEKNYKENWVVYFYSKCYKNEY